MFWQEYDVINLTHSKKKVRINTEILGFTDVSTEEFVIEGISNEQKKPARISVRQCPLLKYGILENIVTPHKATLHCEVIDSETEKLIYKQSYTIGLLPHDQMIWEIRDVKQSRVHDLVDFICAWIYPTDKDGLLDTVRASSIKYHPDKAFGDKIRTLHDIEMHGKSSLGLFI